MSILKITEKTFSLKKQGGSFKNELLAALTTFSTLSYFILLVPGVLAQAGMNFDSALTATLLTSAFATLLMGLMANYPFALAPSVALNAYFTYSIVQSEGFIWQAALGAVFCAGALLFILNCLHVRRLIIESVPKSLAAATTAGLGLFLAFIGLKNAQIIVGDAQTLVKFGNPLHSNTLLTATGLIFIAVFLYWKVPGAIFLSILLNWIIALATGISKWQGIVSLPAGIDFTFLKLDLSVVYAKGFFEIFLSLLFVSLFDVSGTVIALVNQGKFAINNKIPRLTRTLFPDAISSMVAGLLGTSSIGIYLESATGISAGGKTGLTALLIACLFLLSLFFAPFAASVPLAIVTPALIVIGALMMKALFEVNWKDPTDWLPSFVTFLLIPLTSNVAIGIAVGFILFPLMKLFTGKYKEISLVSWILFVLFILKFVYF